MTKVGLENDSEMVGRIQQRENTVGPNHIDEMSWWTVEYIFNNINP